MTRRRNWFSGAMLVAMGLAAVLPGCGGGSSEVSPTGEVVPVAPLNPKPGVGPVSEEYRTMAPGAAAAPAPAPAATK